MDDRIVDFIFSLITGWGIAGTILSPFVGPVVVERFIKPYFSDSTIGARGTKRRKLTLVALSAALTGFASYTALINEYSHSTAAYVSVFVVAFQIAVVEFIMSRIDKHNHELADRLRDQLYLGEDTELSPGYDDNTTPRNNGNG